MLPSFSGLANLKVKTVPLGRGVSLVGFAFCIGVKVCSLVAMNLLMKPFSLICSVILFGVIFFYVAWFLCDREIEIDYATGFASASQQF